MFRDVPGYSGMFRNVPECSMFLVLSTPLVHSLQAFDHCSHAHFFLFFAISELTPVPKVCLSRSFLYLILHIFFHNYYNFVMFQDVPECSMFPILSTASRTAEMRASGLQFKCKFRHALCVLPLSINRNA